LNIAGTRYPWTSPPILALVAVALVMGGFFVLRLLTAPEPLIPIAILTNPIVRCAIAANAFGWGAIIGLNVFLPMYLQGVLGLSPSQAGLSLVPFMFALNTCAGFAGQLLGRVRHYKLVPMIGLFLSIIGVAILAYEADKLTLVSFQMMLILIGAGFGPMPSLTAVAIQNVVPRHQLGISVGTMNFSRNLFATFVVAAFGAIVLTGTGLSLSGALQPGADHAAEAFAHVFLAAAASMSVALVALALMEEKPLHAEDEPPT